MRRKRSIGLGRAFLAVILVLLWTTTAMADEKALLAAIDEQAGSYKLVSQKIFDWKELGQQEVKSSQLLMAELRKLGFKVAGDLPVPDDLVKGGVAKTAFRAELNGKGPGPTITFMLEYDALPNGHSCGHNLIATSSLLAAAALAKLMKEMPGRLIVIGTPDEERGSLGGGKVALLEGKHFEGSDVVLITHPGSSWNLDQRSLAVKRAMFFFKGKAAHAAAAPHLGINALDAVRLTFNGVDMLRQQLRQDVRVHGIIHKGGKAANIIPDDTQAEFMVRALDTVTMEQTYDKVVNCAKAAELATGAKLQFTPPRTALKSPIPVPELLKTVEGHMKAMGVQMEEDREGFGSSDLGNVGHAYPTVNIRFKIAPKGVATHSDPFRELASSEEGWKATITAAKVVGLTAYQLLNDPAKVKTIKDRFTELKAREGK